jgi:hypothetical protein
MKKIFTEIQLRKKSAKSFQYSCDHPHKRPEMPHKTGKIDHQFSQAHFPNPLCPSITPVSKTPHLLQV